MGMLRLYRRVRREGSRSRLLLQIHDELVLESPPDELAGTAAAVREEMTTPLERELQIKVPLKVDLAAGPNWLDVEELQCPASGFSPGRGAGTRQGGQRPA